MERMMKTDAWNPQQYDKFKEERSQPFYDLMSLLQPVAQPDVVDLGCGTGELTAVLHDHLKARTTTGIDTSDEMLKRASAFANANLTFSRQDIAVFDAPKKFDIVFSNAALRPQGQVAIQMPMNHDYPTHILADQMSHEEPWATLLKTEKYEKQKTMLTVEDYATLMFRLGFKEQRVFLRVYGHELESRSGVIEWVKGTLLTHFKSRLSETDYEEFLSRFQERLFARLPDERPFFYPFKRILIWGRL